MDNYVVANGKSISTKSGIIGEGSIVTAKMIGSEKAFKNLKQKGYIVKSSDYKDDSEEVIELRSTDNSENEPKNESKSNDTGAKRK